MESLIENVTSYQELVRRFSPFTGYFPPIVDGAIMEIVLSTIPGHPKRETVSKGQLAERFSTLAELENLKTDTGNENVEKVVQETVSAGKPLGLYLRNFMFGVRLHEGRNDPYNIPQVLSLASTKDVKLQNSIMKLMPDLPWIKISNPAADLFGFENSLILDNDQWEEPVKLLISRAAVIVMYYVTLTPGVSVELELLRKTAAQQKTLIIITGNDPRKDELAITVRQLFGTPGEIDASVSDREFRESQQTLLQAKQILAEFPYQISLEDNEEDGKHILTLLKEILNKASVIPSQEIIKFPPRPQPIWEALLLAKEQAQIDFDLGTSFYEKGLGEDAEHAIIRSIAFSYWSRDPFGRALGYFMLGKVERTLLKYPNEAVQCYSSALDIFELLLPGSETSKQYFEPLAMDFINYLRELKDEKRASSVQDQLDRVMSVLASST